MKIRAEKCRKLFKLQERVTLRTHAITVVIYILWKLKPFCLLSVVLFPFLTACTTKVQHVTAYNLSNSISTANGNKQYFIKTDLQHQQNVFVEYNADTPRIFLDTSMHKEKKERFKSNINSCKKINRHLHSSNHSLIILSKAYLSQMSFQTRTSDFQYLVKTNDVRNKRDALSFGKASAATSSIDDKERLTNIVLVGLGLKRLPDMKKVNISQSEYTTKYAEYLKRIQSHGRKGNSLFSTPSLAAPHLFSIVPKSISDITEKRWRHKRNVYTNQKQLKPETKKNKNELQSKTNILLHFPLGINDAHFQPDSIHEANIRLMVIYSSSLAAQEFSNKRKNRKIIIGGNGVKTQSPCGIERGRQKGRSHILNLKVYQLLTSKRRELLDVRKLEFENVDRKHTDAKGMRSQWLEFDVTKAVRRWLNKSHENLGIEVQCDKCKRIGARILSDTSPSADIEDQFHIMPVLNIIGFLGQTHREGGVLKIDSQSNQSQNNLYHQMEPASRKSIKNCYKNHQRCCRHQLDIVFKKIKGFEFIIQPKMFDAGFCQGRCPPRHNPAHHHALLQSLLWQEDHSRVPRPSCAPSRLEELEVLHVDEDHNDKLKISTWNEMKVVECACS